VKSKHILIIVANPAVSTTLGWPVGFWAAELIHPYDALTKAGHRVTIASPAGGKVEPDGYSDPRDASGYSKDDTLSLVYLNNPEFMKLLENTPPVSALNAADFDAILIAGGQSPMFTFRNNAPLQKLFLGFVHAGKPSAALCHGTCLLLDLKNADGTPFVRGRRMTGFANSEEDFADQVVGKKVMPFRIEDEARALGVEFIAAPAFQPHAVADGHFITGQQQHSGHEVAKHLLAALA
jgi:putative intracellular protease/amidase